MPNISQEARVGLNGMNPVAQRYGLGTLLDNASGISEGNAYYVDGNAKFNGNGTSWDSPYDTLTEACAASHANIANSIQRGWAWRNKIYCKGDRLDEDLVAFPQKTDVIGVGSCDAFVGVGIIGNHAPVNTHYGTRFYNCNFFPQANADIVTLTSSGSGCQFIGCRFVGVWGAITAPSAIDITASPMCKIIGNTFEGGFGTNVIDIDAGDASGLKIIDNTIVGGADNGILIDAGATIVGATSSILIQGNLVQVADITIDDNANAGVFVVDNRCISAGAYGATSHVITVATAVGNIVTANNDTKDVPIKAV